MACEFSANALQTVQANGSVIFTETPVPCSRGCVFHRDDSGLFRLANRQFRQNFNCCGCRANSNYEVAFHANIAVPTDPAGTVEEISLALAVDGEIDPSSIMTFTPTVAGDFGNVGADIIVSVPWICSCSSVSVRNVSTQPILVQNANLVIDN